MNLTTAKLSIDILNKFTELLKQDSNTNTQKYINIFSKVVNYFYSMYRDNLIKREQAESTKILSQFDDILRINLEIIDSSNEHLSKENTKRIASLRLKRNKLMEAYINKLKEEDRNNE
ncbi:BlyB family putative holin accessory protein [Borrelia puertoricensis]|uniref:BlyB family putative holin accessory protein n=1 Tax=Borrelia puertoricensis TaxID=2756107 RepID=UPI001FF235C3|nr:BlyB family putative holin accessory protein [Borrelia puertoricensis]UPA18457.1 hypothetical protein bpuSUM_000955 [Borrelia puertoricensis]UPA18765.1 hypothetical protein bpuSUM_001334 [Borrelia puertoricensis]UPA18801.1 hypothetical protein bpuSUM_001290 [Borrelia puertoricensis]